jgi:hypothetical protein
MSKSLTIFLVLLTALALLIAGCGGSDDETSGGNGSTVAADAPPTKAEFSKAAEEVCDKARDRRYNKAVKYREDHAKELKAMEPIAAEEKIVVDVVLPAILEEAEELDALPVPKGDEKKIEAIIAGMEKGVKVAEKKPSRAWLEVPSEYAFRNVGLKIRAYGLVDCRNVA